MKIAPRDQDKFIKSPPSYLAGVIIYGPNTPQIAQYGQDIAKTIVPDLNDPFNVVTLTSDNIGKNPSILADELASQSLMGGRRLIRIKNASDKMTAALKNALDIAQGSENFFLIECGGLTPRSSLRKLGETAKNIGILACYEDDEQSLSSYIQRQLTSQGLTIDRDVAPYLAHQLSGNRALADRMVEKIITYLGAIKSVTLEDAKNCSAAPSETSLDTAVQAALDGNQKNLDEAVQILWGEGVSPIAIIRMTQNQLYRLRKVQANITQGTPMDAALKTLRPPIFFKAKPAFTRQLRNWPAKKIDRALSHLLRLEVQCKKTGTPDKTLTHRILAGLSG